MPDTPDIDASRRTEIEAAIFRKLVAHLQKYPEVQNIDLMNLAYFCRNCLSKWYAAEARDRGVELEYEQARELVYGMPYEQYKARHQREPDPVQLARFATARDKATD